MTPAEAGMASQTAYLQQLRPYVEAEVAAMQKAIAGKARILQQRGELSGEKALSFWLEWFAADSLRARFAGKIATSQQVGERIAAEM